jgi:Putative zinc-finger
VNGHDEYLELLAASIDFGLTEEEVARLNYHLASCPECRRAATELRGQAAAIATTPIAPLAPARSEQILRAAMRKPAARPRWGMLAVAALLATLGGGVLFAGFQLINDDDPAPDQSPPIVAEVSAPPSEAPVEESADPGGEQPPDDGPRVTPNPGSSGPPDLDIVDFEFPLPYSSDISNIRVAPLADGRVWVSFGAGNGTVLALLDETGSGSPILVPGAEDCVPLAVADGSVRLPCAFSDADACVDICYEDGVFAYSPSLNELPGFPVALSTAVPVSVDRRGARVVGTSVVVGVLTSADEDDGGIRTAWLMTVSADGSVAQGPPIEGVGSCCAISPDGIGFGKSVESHDDGTQTTTHHALGTTSYLDGWPLPMPGTGSGPTFGPNGDVYFSSWLEEGSQFTQTRDGTPVASVDIADWIAWDPSSDGPIPPLVDERGRMWVVIEDAILGFGSDLAPLAGFPYKPETAFLEQGNDCGPGDTGCQSWIEPPRMAPRGRIYSLETGPAGGGDRITVVNPDGAIRSGWPKTLQREGASWDSVTIGENRVAYAVAIEPEPNNESSISILAFAPNGTREWIRTLVEP